MSPPILRVACASAVALTAGFAQTARAQTADRNPAAAQALYDEARRLESAGDYAAACPKFKESYRLDPGGGTELNLADCYEKQGKSALAWSTFKEALVTAQRDGRGDRVDFATAHIAALESRLAHLVVRVPAAARAPGLSVTVDGSTLGDAAWGLSMPVDPGKHLIVASAPGKRTYSVSLEIPAGAAAEDSVDIPLLAPEAAGAPAGGESGTPADVPPAGGGGGSGRTTAGWIVAGVGVAAIGVGGYFGLRSFSRWGDRNTDCAGGCTPAAKAAGDDARDAATISTVAIGAGLATVAVGTYLLLSGQGGAAAPKSASVSLLAEIVPGREGIFGMRGVF